MTHCHRCGKDNPAEIHTCTPLALVLADELTTLTGTQKAKRTTAKQAADELRRLHAENEVHKNTGAQLAQMIGRDEALLRQALEKLEKLRVTIDSEWGECRDLDEIDAAGDQWPVVNAIRERLGTKT